VKIEIMLQAVTTRRHAKVAIHRESTKQFDMINLGGEKDTEAANRKLQAKRTLEKAIVNHITDARRNTKY